MENRNTEDVSFSHDAKLLYCHCSSGTQAERNAAYQQLGRFLLRIALSRLRTQPQLSELARDCTQETLAIIYDKLNRGQGPERPEWFLTWSASIVLHKLYDELRKLGRRTHESLIDDGDEESWALQIPDANAIAPEAWTLYREGMAELLSLIQNHPHLRDEMKTVLIGGFFDERDDQELATVLGIAKATVRVLRHRGLKVLRTDLVFLDKLHALNQSIRDASK